MALPAPIPTGLSKGRKAFANSTVRVVKKGTDFGGKMTRELPDTETARMMHVPKDIG